MPARNFGTVINMGGPDATGSLIQTTYQSKIGLVAVSATAGTIIKLRPEEEYLTIAVVPAFDGATVLTSIDVRLYPRSGTAVAGLLMQRMDSANPAAAEWLLTSSDNGKTIIFQTTAPIGLLAGCVLQARGTGGLTKVGDTISATAVAVAVQR